MKKQIFTLAFGLCAAFGYSQNSNPWPTSGNVGIGTGSPRYKLDVVYGVQRFSPNTANVVNLAFLGYRPSLLVVGQVATDTGLLVQDIRYPSPYSGAAIKLSTLSSDAPAGYLELNSPASANTTRAAVTAGFEGTELFRINRDGKVRIGNDTNDAKTPDGYKLFVEDGILTEKVRVSVKTTANWADYVFAPEYNLMPLSEVEKFTKENNHLPNVPSAKELTENGLDVAQMDAKLMEKVEELTLYLIEQNKQIEQLKAEVKTLKEQKQ